MHSRRAEPVTARRLAILEAIADSVRDLGYPPTTREIGAAVGPISPSIVHFHLARLADAGLLVREERISRGLRITPAGRAALREARGE